MQKFTNSTKDALTLKGAVPNNLTHGQSILAQFHVAPV